MSVPLKGRSLKTLTKEQLIAVLEWIDVYAGPADSTCDEPGVALSEAAIRIMIEENPPRFYGHQIAVSRKRNRSSE